MAISSIVKNKRDGTLTIKDNGGANTLVVAFEAGDFQLQIPGPTVSSYMDRGVLGATPSLRYVDDQPMTGSFTAYLRDISDAAYATLEEILCQTGFVASTWVSTMGASGEVKTYTAQWDIEGTNHGDASDHQIICQFCVFSGSLQEGDPGQISMSFTAYDLYPSVT